MSHIRQQQENQIKGSSSTILLDQNFFTWAKYIQCATLIYFLGCKIGLLEVFWHPIIFWRRPCHRYNRYCRCTVSQRTAHGPRLPKKAWHVWPATYPYTFGRPGAVFDASTTTSAAPACTVGVAPCATMRYHGRVGCRAKKPTTKDTESRTRNSAVSNTNKSVRHRI